MHESAVRVGAAMGLLGMIGFGVYHWFYVAPVVAVWIEGALWGGASGALVGLAYKRAMPSVDRRRDLWFAIVMIGALIPYELVGLIWGPFAQITRPSQILPMLPITLVGLPWLAVGGWLLTRDRRATWTLVGAGFLLHFFIGGSAAHFGGRGQTLAMVLLMGSYEFFCALLIGPLSRRIAAPSSNTPVTT